MKEVGPFVFSSKSVFLPEPESEMFDRALLIQGFSPKICSKDERDSSKIILQVLWYKDDMKAILLVFTSFDRNVYLSNLKETLKFSVPLPSKFIKINHCAKRIVNACSGSDLGKPFQHIHYLLVPQQRLS